MFYFYTIYHLDFYKSFIFIYLLHLLLQVREDEISELEFHLTEHCPLPVKGGVENNYGKINILLQTFISKGFVDTFSLVSDLAYVAQVWKTCL